MSIRDRIKKDLKRFVENKNLNSQDLEITSPTGVVMLVTGIHSKHYLGVNTLGNNVNTKNAHCAFMESSITDLGYTIRDGSGEVTLKNYLVKAEDSTGILKNYKIREWFPNEDTGLIVCILGDYV